MSPGKKCILIADDEPDILEILQYNLNAHGYAVIEARNGLEALEKAREFRPQLILLDVMMPYKNGFEVCEILRSQPEFADTPILFLTALGDESKEIKGLESGADDYITKPISPRVLVSRVNAQMRRIKDDEVLTFGDLRIDKHHYSVSVAHEEVSLAKKEFELLALLASNPQKVFLRNEILDTVWGTDVIVGDRTIDVHVRKIRQKIGEEYICTVKGVGYKLAAGM